MSLEVAEKVRLEILQGIYDSFKNGQKKQFCDQVEEYDFKAFVDQITDIVIMQEAFRMTRYYILHSGKV